MHIQSLSVSTLARISVEGQYVFIRNRGETKRQSKPVFGPIGGAVSVGMERAQKFMIDAAEFLPSPERHAEDGTIDLRFRFESPPITDDAGLRLAGLCRALFNSLNDEELSPLREMYEELTNEDARVMSPVDLEGADVTRTHQHVYINKTPERLGRLHMYQLHAVELGAHAVTAVRAAPPEIIRFVAPDKIADAVRSGDLLDTSAFVVPLTARV